MVREPFTTLGAQLTLVEEHEEDVKEAMIDGGIAENEMQGTTVSHDLQI